MTKKVGGVLSEPQVDLLARVQRGEHVKIHEVNTLTLASLLSRGLVKAQKHHLRLTPLGLEQFRFTLNHHYLKWRDQLEDVRRLKLQEKNLDKGKRKKEDEDD